MNKSTGFILILIIGGILVGWKEYEKRARGDVHKRLSNLNLMSIEQSPLTLVQRTQLMTMAKLERSKIRVMVEHDNSPITVTYPMILDATGSYDPDLGDQIYFNWIQLSGKKVRLKPNNESAKVSFLGEAGEYVFELSVTDNYGARNTIVKSVLIEPEPNVAPVINLKVRQGAELK